MRFIVKLAIGSVLIVLVLVTVNRLWVRPSAQPAGLPSIELIREKAELVTLEIHGSCIATAELSGLTGGVSCVVIVSGAIQLGSDLNHARYEQVDRERKTTVLVLPEPVVLNHRIDLDRTRTYDVSRSGLWIGLPFGVREEEVIAAAYLRGETDRKFDSRRAGIGGLGGEGLGERGKLLGLPALRIAM